MSAITLFPQKKSSTQAITIEVPTGEAAYWARQFSNRAGVIALVEAEIPNLPYLGFVRCPVITGEETGPEDYVVSVNLETGDTEAWAGGRFRNLDERKFHQYKISMAISATEAKKRALSIHNLLRGQ